ncbi:MAG TPA: T9SS type A sorting domain-containing protein [Ignavibacteria bacterium]|nr:T9SS type A sorting domain-containing protein [Ignavibacteria bacterium]HMR41429.1 T9SS type A sorting domain-containing protein [Ignavibacteria bacterium]
MKIKIFIILFVLSGYNICKSQSFLEDLFFDKDYLQKNVFSLQKAPELSIDDLIFNKVSQLQEVGTYFKYHDQLSDGSFIVQIENNRVYLKILKKSNSKIEYLAPSTTSSKALKSTDIIDVIIFEVKKIDGFSFLDMLNASNYIDEDGYNKNLKESNSSLSSSMNNYVWNPRIIIDKSILSGFNPHASGKILNRSKARTYLETMQHNPVNLYSDVTAGTIVPYDGGTRAKIFTVDKMWDRIIWFDIDKFNANASFPQFAIKNPSSSFFTLNYPTDITHGTMKVINNGLNDCGFTGKDTIYHLYISELSNNRIAKVDYRIRTYVNNCWLYVVNRDFNIVDNSFTVVKGGCNKPYSLSLHKGSNALDMSDDVIWYSEGEGLNKRLNCINANTGADIPGQSINTIDFGRGPEIITPTRISVYRSPNGLINMLAFVEERRNAIVFLKLDSYGRADFSHQNFLISYKPFEDQHLKSVILTSNDNGIEGVTAWAVTNAPGGCGPICGSIHTFKVNTINNIPLNVDYLASYWTGLNSDNSFVGLNNLQVQNGFLDIFTMETWNDNYGIRRFKPGVDILTSNATNYCRDLNNMKINLRITNPAKIQFEDALYSHSGGPWIVMPGMQVNGMSYNSEKGYYYLPAGTTTLNIYVPGLPTMGDVPDPKLKIKFTICPQDENISSSSNKIIKEYNPTVGNCNQGGGCPFVFVEDIDGLKLDNNILHRSEFDENIGRDIEDKYMLKVLPKLDENGICVLKIKELNNDVSYFDKFSLVAIDHPVGTNLGITENSEYVLYFPTITSSPNYAEHDGENVTTELGYDSNYTKIVEGDVDDVVSANFDSDRDNSLLNRMNNVLYDALKGLNNSHIKNSKNNKSKKSNNQFDFGFAYSMAVILDPSSSDLIIWGPPNKRDAGTIDVYDSQSEPLIEDFLFAKRENGSDVIIPVGKQANVDSIASVWNSDFQISFLSVTPVYYDGYIENPFDLIEAVDSLNGDVLNFLTEIDQNYAVMDSTSNLTLKFKVNQSVVPQGWLRDYVLITNGRYENIAEGDNRVSVNQNSAIPKVYRLQQNYPNPFNPVTKINFDLPNSSMVKLIVYDILGKEVMRLIKNEFREPGRYSVEFNGSNLSSGIYFYRLETDKFVQTKRMVLVK